MNNRLKTSLLLPILCWVFLVGGSVCAQMPQADLPHYPFIKYDANQLHFDSASPSMQHLFAQWQRVASTGTGNLNIVHIGASHVQAGVLSNTIRRRVMAAHPDLVASRGLVFPYSAAAKCNNPPDYRIHCKERMLLTRNVYKEHDVALGACGIAVTAADTLTEVQLVLADAEVDYGTVRVVVLGRSAQGVQPYLHVEGVDIMPSFVDTATDRFVFNLRQQVDSFAVMLPCRVGEQFSLTGIYLGNRKAGFSVSSLGVNGASTSDWLRCRHLVRDLRLVHPDVVVFGIGINDAFGTDFDSAVFRQQYLQLVDSVRAVNPDCAFIFVTNNDCYRHPSRKRYAVNPNGPVAREVFYRLAAEVGGAVWDQFEVMGGLRSMDRWRQAKLARTDRVHFTTEGYRLVGDMFCNALFQAIDEYAAQQK